MHFTTAEMAAWVGSVIWPLTRISAMVIAAPLLGGRSMPMRLRLILVLVLTGVMLPLVGPVPAVEPLSPLGLLITAQQVLIGLAMGFMLRLAFGALELAGYVVAMQMGLGFASLVDPQSGSQMPLLSHFYQLCGYLIFLALNGHLLLIQLLADSFALLPVGPEGLFPDDLWTLVSWASHMFFGAVLISLPAVASLLLVNLAFGVITRAAPQLNIFMVGFPVSLMLGLVIVLYSLPALLPQLRRLLEDVFATAHGLLA